MSAYIGNTQFGNSNAFYVGNTPISKLYIGNNQFWPTNIVTSNYIVSGASFAATTDFSPTATSLSTTNNITTFVLSPSSSIVNNAFDSANTLTEAYFWDVRLIQTRSFYNTGNLLSASFPNAVTVGYEAFLFAGNLVSASFPNATFVGYQAFYGTKIVSASFPKVTYVDNGAFNSCLFLKNIYLPSASTINNNAFTNITASGSATLKNGMQTNPAVGDLIAKAWTITYV